MKIAFKYIIYILTGIVIGGFTGLLIISSHSDGNHNLLEKFLGRDKESSLGLEIGYKAPDFMLFSTDGELLSLSDSLGKPAVINFWATWCAPCLIEMPLLQDKYDVYSSKLLITGVNAGESLSVVQKFVTNNEITFPTLLDPSESIQKMYGIRGYPTTYFIDKNGVIMAVHIGVLTEKQLNEYLKIIGVFNG